MIGRGGGCRNGCIAFMSFSNGINNSRKAFLSLCVVVVDDDVVVTDGGRDHEVGKESLWGDCQWS